MSRRAARARLESRNARLLARAGLPPAPRNPPPTTRGILAANGRLERGGSSIETKRVPEDVGCTQVRLDYADSREKGRTSQQRSNNGRKIDRDAIGDGSMATFEATIGRVELARQATMDAAAAARKVRR